jgi:hypothetical protein
VNTDRAGCHPNAVPAEGEELVIALRARHPSWGAPKIRARLEREQAPLALPAESMSVK